MGYTLAQFRAFLAAARRRERAHYGTLLWLTALGAQGGRKAIQEALKRLDEASS
ncbi:MAG: hypothetical protein AB1830_07735 [Pseudomonadota bacterium]